MTKRIDLINRAQAWARDNPVTARHLGVDEAIVCAFEGMRLLRAVYKQIKHRTPDSRRNAVTLREIRDFVDDIYRIKEQEEL